MLRPLPSCTVFSDSEDKGLAAYRGRETAIIIKGVHRFASDVSRCAMGPVGAEWRVEGSMDTLIGKTLGQYEVQELIGRGGMAAVYRAYQPSLHRAVAIKVLSPLGASDPSFLARFRREAAVVAYLQHPNILPVYDFGEQDGLLYIVMMLVSGGTLGDRLAQPLPFPMLITIGSQIAGALDYAHRRGVIHRDVKPSNILMGGPDWSLLSDFGIARMLEGDTQLTRTGTGIGTATYMSPEQGQGRPVDARSDIYSLGVVIYEMLTGQPPYQADTTMGIIHQHIHAPLPSPSTLRPDIPPALEAIVAKTLAKQPTDRYQTAVDLKQDLENALDALRALPARQGPSAQPDGGPTEIASTLPVIPTGPPATDRLAPTDRDRAALSESSPPMVSGDRSAGQVVATRPSREALRQAASGQVARPGTGTPQIDWRWIAAGAAAGVVIIGIVFAALALAGIFDDEPTPQARATPTAIATTPTPRPATPTPTVTPTVTTTPLPRGVVYEENFSNPARSGWVGDRENVYIDGGKLHLIAKEPGRSYRTWPATRPQIENFVYEADITKVSGPERGAYGLVFRDRGGSNYYAFWIYADGRYELDKYVDGSPHAILRPTASAAVAKGNATNVLRVETTGPQLRLFVNGQLVGEVEDDHSARGSFGLIAAPIVSGGGEMHVTTSRVRVARR